jgi:hypothetical protein
MGFEFGGAALRLAVSLAISNWFHWSLRPQPSQTYEIEPLLATRFLFPRFPFPAPLSTRAH